MDINDNITISFSSSQDYFKVIISIVYITLYVLYIYSICISISLILFYSFMACLKTRTTLFDCLYLYLFYRHTLVKSDKEEEEECLLCLNPIKNNIIFKKCCYIKLHLFCLFQYLRYSEQCPICHLPIT